MINDLKTEMILVKYFQCKFTLEKIRRSLTNIGSFGFHYINIITMTRDTVSLQPLSYGGYSN